MSYMKCCVPGCSTATGTQTLHNFPNPAKDLERFRSWLYNIGGDILAMPNEYIYKNRRICRSHFENKYCCRFNRISNIAIPTVNMPGLSTLKFSHDTTKEWQPLRQTQNFSESVPSTLKGEDTTNDVIDIYDDSPSDPAEPIAGTSTLISVTAPTTTPSAESAAPAQAGPSVTIAEEAQGTPTADEKILKLEPDILQLLGEDPTNQKNYGDSLHKDIASRWTHILINGLSKETQMELMKSYLPPENCPNMKAPKLNLEIKAALSDVNIKKDLYSQSKQNQLASSLAAIGRALNWALSSNNIVPQDIIKSLSDAGRLVCDSHYKESLSRRYAALSTLNRSIKDTVKNTNIDEHLFGSALSEHIKTSKAINKTGSEIKQRIQRPRYRTLPTMQSRGALNSRGAPPRIAAAVEPRPTPAPRRPPRDRRQEAPRGRRPTSNTRHQRRR